MIFAGVLLTASMLLTQAPDSPPDAAAIMRRVAENQQKVQAARSAWV
jgi:hypothetical protein